MLPTGSNDDAVDWSVEAGTRNPRGSGCAVMTGAAMRLIREHASAG
jgi:hypothetical protein